MSFNVSDNRYFSDSIIDRECLLDGAIDWINTNLTPDDVFDSSTLDDWALTNGYEKAAE